MSRPFRKQSARQLKRRRHYFKNRDQEIADQIEYHRQHPDQKRATALNCYYRNHEKYKAEKRITNKERRSDAALKEMQAIREKKQKATDAAKEAAARLGYEGRLVVH